GDPRSLPAALPPDPDDDGGRDARGPSARVRPRHGLGAAPAARLRHGRRSRAEPALDALHYAGGLSLSRPRAGLAQRRQGACATRARAAARRFGGVRATSSAHSRESGHLEPPPRIRDVWVPAFAGTNGCCADPTRPGRTSKRDRRAHEIALAELDPAVAQDVV